jgi:tetratricopeptide (TPR) repeat protein
MKLVMFGLSLAQMRYEEAYKAYRSGQEPKATELFREAAELAGESGDVALEQNALRMQGNSLMWSGRHEEAFRVLTRAASYDKSDAEPGAVYGAKTDRILLSLSHAPAALCREMLRDARAYLERIGKPEWSHRVEMLEGVLYYRQGDFIQSAEFTIRAIRLADRCIGGPAYMRSSHIKWITRPLFYSHQKDALNEWALQNSREPEISIGERLKQNCVRLLALRLERADGVDVGNSLRDEAQHVAVIASDMRGVWDEVFEIGRALMLAGEWEALDRLPIGRMQALPFESALFAADREINLLRRKLELPQWDGDLDWPQATPLAARKNSGIETELQKIRIAFARLRAEAARENQRMEAKTCTIATESRVEHVAMLLPWIDFR